MRIERHNTGWWVIARGNEDRPQFFAFFVDADRSSWSKRITEAARHMNYETAEATLKQIRERESRKRAKK